jgi:hypothetical protein
LSGTRCVTPRPAGTRDASYCAAASTSSVSAWYCPSYDGCVAIENSSAGSGEETASLSPAGACSAIGRKSASAASSAVKSPGGADGENR